MRQIRRIEVDPETLKLAPLADREREVLKLIDIVFTTLERNLEEDNELEEIKSQSGC